jgi:hypothetical protein
MHIPASALLGAWTLVEWRVDTPSTGRAAWPFGQNATGLIVYEPGGWMSATLSQRVRTGLSAASVRQADERSRSRVVTEYLAYAGRWSIDGARVVHDVAFSLNPTLLGTRQVRDVSFLGADLVLSATESDGTQERVHRLHWRRP